MSTKAFYNDVLVEELKINIPLSDRAFAYGDGLFETIMIQKGEIQFLTQHINRLKKGMEAFGMKGWSKIKESKIQQQFEQLQQANQLEETGRARIQVWRKEGGLYTPKQHHYNLLLTLHPSIRHNSFKKINVGFAKSVRIQYATTSAYKTMSALSYVMAGIEKENRKIPD